MEEKLKSSSQNKKNEICNLERKTNRSLLVLFFLIVINWLCGLLWGYSIKFFILYPVNLLCIVGILAYTIISSLYLSQLALKKGKIYFSSIKLFILIFIFFILPRINLWFSPPVAGSLFALYRADPSLVVKEGKQLISEYQPLEDLPFNKIKNIPPAIKQLDPIWIRAYKDKVLIKKYGLGDFSGFIIAYDPSIEIEGVKLKEDLYWFEK